MWSTQHNQIEKVENSTKNENLEKELAFAAGLLVGAGYTVEKIQDDNSTVEKIQEEKRNSTVDFSVRQFPFSVRVDVTMSNGDMKNFYGGVGLPIVSTTLPNTSGNYLKKIQVFVTRKSVTTRNPFTGKTTTTNYEPQEMFFSNYDYNSNNFQFSVYPQGGDRIEYARQYDHSDGFVSSVWVKYETSRPFTFSLYK